MRKSNHFYSNESSSLGLLWGLLLMFFCLSCASKEAPPPPPPTAERAEAVETPVDPLEKDEKPMSATEPSRDFDFKKLSNGLEVYAVKKTDIPMVTVLIAVRNGAFVETPDIDGLAHLYEHMFFKANEEIPSQKDFLDATDELGVEIGPTMNASTSTESVRYYFTIQSEYLERGLEFLSHALIRPAFLQEELEKERVVVKNEFDRFEASPHSVFFQWEMLQRMFTKHFSRKNTIGTREIILSATPEQMREMQSKYYIPNNSALFIVGDYDEESLWPTIQKHYGSWVPGTEPFEVSPIPEHPALEETVEFTHPDEVQNVTIIRGYHGPKLGMDDEGVVSLTVARSMINMDASPFQKELVESGLATEASMFIWPQRYTSPVFFYVETTPEKSEAAYKKLGELIDRMLKGELFSEEFLRVVKSSSEVRQAYERESGQSYAMGVAGIWTSTGNLDYYIKYIERLRALQLDDILENLREYIEGKHYVAGALVPEGSDAIQLGQKIEPIEKEPKTKKEPKE